MYDYVKQHRWAMLKVGMVFTAALFIIFLAVMFAGNIEKVFIPRAIVYAMVDDVKGLRGGSPVWFSGVEIGAVKSIEFTVHQKVKVELSIVKDSLRHLKKDSRAKILTLGLLGDKYVEITPGSYEADSLAAGDIIGGDVQIELQDVVQTSQSSIAKISDFVGMLEEILVKIDKGEGALSKFIRDPDVYENLNEALKESRALVSKIESGQGSMGRLLSEDSLYNDLSATARDIRMFARSLKESEGTLNKMIYDPTLYDRFQKASESLDMFTRKLLTSRGTVNRLIEDESLYENLNSASYQLSNVLERIERGEGLMGSLVADEELSEELKTTLKELNALISDIKENPGRYFKFSLF